MIRFRQKIARVFWVIIAMCPIHSSAYGARLELGSHEEYVGIKQLGLDLLGHFSRLDTVFIAIGQSPTPVFAFLQNLEGVEAVNMPLTGDSFRYKSADGSLFMGKGGPLKEDSLEILLQYLRRFLDKPNVRSALHAGKRVVFVDFRNTGATAHSMFTFLNTYQSRYEPDLHFAFAFWNAIDSETFSRGRGIHDFPTGTIFVYDRSEPAKLVINEMSKAGDYKALSQYGKYDPIVDGEGFPEERPQYASYRRTILDWMRTDPEIAPLIKYRIEAPNLPACNLLLLGYGV